MWGSRVAVAMVFEESGKLAGALVGPAIEVSDRTVGKLLRGLGFRLHANQKTREGEGSS